VQRWAYVLRSASVAASATPAISRMMLRIILPARMDRSQANSRTHTRAWCCPRDVDTVSIRNDKCAGVRWYAISRAPWRVIRPYDTWRTSKTDRHTPGDVCTPRAAWRACNACRTCVDWCIGRCSQFYQIEGVV
jgi:hypothetical protein